MLTESPSWPAMKFQHSHICEAFGKYRKDDYLSCDYFLKTLEAFSQERERLARVWVGWCQSPSQDLCYPPLPRSAPEAGLQGPPQSRFKWGAGGQKSGSSTCPSPRLTTREGPASLCRGHGLLSAEPGTHRSPVSVLGMNGSMGRPMKSTKEGDSPLRLSLSRLLTLFEWLALCPNTHSAMGKLSPSGEP